MNRKIKFQDQNHANGIRANWDDEQWITEFFEFLQGKQPEGMCISTAHAPRLSPKKAFSIIWYLQEHMRVLPSNIEKCWSCGNLYNSNAEGLYWESKGRHYCGSCEYEVPENYDNCLR